MTKNSFVVVDVTFQHRQSIIHFPSPPWQQSSSHEEQIATSVPGITGRADNISLRCQYSITTIASYQADYVIYIDGSTSRGTRNEGAAAVVTSGSLLQSGVATTIKTRELLPAPTRKKQLPWNLHYPRLPPTPNILQPP